MCLTQEKGVGLESLLEGHFNSDIVKIIIVYIHHVIMRSDSLLSEPVDFLLEALVLWIPVVLVLTAEVVRTGVPGVGGL